MVEQLELVGFFRGSVEKVLNFLLSCDEAHSKSEIAREAGVTFKTVCDMWPLFEKHDLVVQTRTVGMAKLYSLNKESKLVGQLRKLRVELAVHNGKGLSQIFSVYGFLFLVTLPLLGTIYLNTTYNASFDNESLLNITTITEELNLSGALLNITTIIGNDTSDNFTEELLNTTFGDVVYQEPILNITKVEPGEIVQEPIIIETTIEESEYRHEPITVGKRVLWYRELKTTGMDNYNVDLNLPSDYADLAIVDLSGTYVLEGDTLTLTGTHELRVSFTTSPVTVAEQQLSIEPYSKKVTVSSESELHYNNIPVSVLIPEGRDIQILEMPGREIAQDPAYNVAMQDTNGNGIADTLSWNVPALSAKEYLVQEIGNNAGIAFDRTLDCDKCGQHKSPSEALVGMTISASFDGTLSNAILSDYFSNEWTVADANGGSVETVNVTHNRISWTYPAIEGVVSQRYEIKAPRLTIPPTSYVFVSELNSWRSEPWEVIVSDARTLASVALSGVANVFRGITDTVTCTPTVTGSGSAITVTNYLEYATTSGWITLSDVNAVNVSTSSTNPQSASVSTTYDFNYEILAQFAGTGNMFRCRATSGVTVYSSTANMQIYAPSINISQSASESSPIELYSDQSDSFDLICGASAPTGSIASMTMFAQWNSSNNVWNNFSTSTGNLRSDQNTPAIYSTVTTAQTTTFNIVGYTIGSYSVRCFGNSSNADGLITNATSIIAVNVVAPPSISLKNVTIGNVSNIYRGDMDTDIYCNATSDGGNKAANITLQYNNGTVGGWINLNQSFFAKNVSYNATYGTNPRWAQTVTTSGTIARFAVFGNWTSTAQFRCNTSVGAIASPAGTNVSSISSMTILAPILNMSITVVPSAPVTLYNDESNTMNLTCNVSALMGNASAVTIYAQFNSSSAQSTWTNITASTALKSNESSPVVFYNVDNATPDTRVFRINSSTIGSYSVRCFANSSSQDGANTNSTSFSAVSVAANPVFQAFVPDRLYYINGTSPSMKLKVNITNSESETVPMGLTRPDGSYVSLGTLSYNSSSGLYEITYSFDYSIDTVPGDYRVNITLNGNKYLNYTSFLYFPVSGINNIGVLTSRTQIWDAYRQEGWVQIGFGMHEMLKEAGFMNSYLLSPKTVEDINLANFSTLIVSYLPAPLWTENLTNKLRNFSNSGKLLVLFGNITSDMQNFVGVRYNRTAAATTIINLTRTGLANSSVIPAPWIDTDYMTTSDPSDGAWTPFSQGREGNGTGMFSFNITGMWCGYNLGCKSWLAINNWTINVYNTTGAPAFYNMSEHSGAYMGVGMVVNNSIIYSPLSLSDLFAESSSWHYNRTAYVYGSRNHYGPFFDVFVNLLEYKLLQNDTYVRSWYYPENTFIPIMMRHDDIFSSYDSVCAFMNTSEANYSLRSTWMGYANTSFDAVQVTAWTARGNEIGYHVQEGGTLAVRQAYLQGIENQHGITAYTYADHGDSYPERGMDMLREKMSLQHGPGAALTTGYLADGLGSAHWGGFMNVPTFLWWNISNSDVTVYGPNSQKLFVYPYRGAGGSTQWDPSRDAGVTEYQEIIKNYFNRRNYIFTQLVHPQDGVTGTSNETAYNKLMAWLASWPGANGNYTHTGISNWFDKRGNVTTYVNSSNSTEISFVAKSNVLVENFTWIVPWKSAWGSSAGIYVNGVDRTQSSELLNATLFNGSKSYLMFITNVTAGTSTILVKPTPDTAAPNIASFKYNVTNMTNYSSTQGYQFNATVTDGTAVDDVWIEHNFTGTMQNITVTTAQSSEYYYNYGKLTAGYYYIKWYANDTLNNRNTTDFVKYYKVNQSYLPITLYINGTDGDKTLYNNSVANFTANFSSSYSFNITLYTNLTGSWTLWDNKVSPLVNYTALSPYQTRAYMIKANFSNQNYSMSQANHSLTLEQAATPGVININYQSPTALSSQIVNQNQTFNVTMNISCSGNDCGNISALLRYNASAGLTPNAAVSTTTGATPFYVPVVGWMSENISDVVDVLYAVDIGDADNDGKKEIVRAMRQEAGSAELAILEKTGSTWAEETILNDDGVSITSLIIGDANNDGLYDVVTADLADVKMYNKTGGSWVATTIATPSRTPNYIDVGDANNDGKNEVVAVTSVSPTAGEVFMYENKTGTWVETTIAELGTNGDVVAIGDADNDGLNEVAVGTIANTNEIRVYKNVSGGWSVMNLATVSVDVGAIEIGDANNDGQQEVVVGLSGTTNNVRMYKNITTSWAETIITSSVAADIRTVAIGDAHNNFTNRIYIGTGATSYNLRSYLNTTGTWVQENIDYVSTGAQSPVVQEIAVGDADNDGENEIAVACGNTIGDVYELKVYEYPSANPKPCYNVRAGGNCSLTWTVSATGTIGTQYQVDVNFTSNITSSTDSGDFQINISLPTTVLSVTTDRTYYRNGTDTLMKVMAKLNTTMTEYPNATIVRPDGSSTSLGTLSYNGTSGLYEKTYTFTSADGTAGDYRVNVSTGGFNYINYTAFYYIPALGKNNIGVLTNRAQIWDLYRQEGKVQIGFGMHGMLEEAGFMNAHLLSPNVVQSVDLSNFSALIVSYLPPSLWTENLTNILRNFSNSGKTLAIFGNVSSTMQDHIGVRYDRTLPSITLFNLTRTPLANSTFIAQPWIDTDYLIPSNNSALYWSPVSASRDGNGSGMFSFNISANWCGYNSATGQCTSWSAINYWNVSVYNTTGASVLYNMTYPNGTYMGAGIVMNGTIIYSPLPLSDLFAEGSSWQYNRTQMLLGSRNHYEPLFDAFVNIFEYALLKNDTYARSWYYPEEAYLPLMIRHDDFFATYPTESAFMNSTELNHSVKSTWFTYYNSSITSAQVNQWTASGHEIGYHVLEGGALSTKQTYLQGLENAFGITLYSYADHGDYNNEHGMEMLFEKVSLQHSAGAQVSRGYLVDGATSSNLGSRHHSQKFIWWNNTNYDVASGTEQYPTVYIIPYSTSVSSGTVWNPSRTSGVSEALEANYNYFYRRNYPYIQLTHPQDNITLATSQTAYQNNIEWMLNRSGVNGNYTHAGLGNWYENRGNVSFYVNASNSTHLQMVARAPIAVDNFTWIVPWKSTWDTNAEIYINGADQTSSSKVKNASLFNSSRSYLMFETDLAAGSTTILIKPVQYGWLNVSYQSPAALLSQNMDQYNTFNVTVNVTCVGGICGSVNGTLRYNASVGINPNTAVSGIVGDTPLYVTPSFINWISNTSLISGLGDIGDVSVPSIAYNLVGDGKWVMISGNNSGEFTGYYWNGAGWTSNTSLVTGLGDIGGASAPVIAHNLVGDGKWVMISGNSSGEFTGYYWNGAGWTSNTSLVTGLADVGLYSAPAIAYNLVGDGKWVMISGNSSGEFTGYYWNGAGWTSNTSLVTGLGDIGDYPIPAIVYNLVGDGGWALITGEFNGGFFGYDWNGGGWTSNTSLVTGLGDVGDDSAPAIAHNLVGDGKWVMISGNVDGTFNGYYANTNYLNPQTCSDLSQNENCRLTWTVNATGTLGSQYWLDVNFTSSLSTVPANDSGDFQINITSGTVDTTAPNIASFKYNVTNMTNYSSTQGYQFNATVTDGTAVDDVWIEHNFTGAMQNVTVTTAQSSEYYYNYGKLAAGYYYIKWWANDTLNNRNTSASVIYYRVNKSSPVLSLTLNGTAGDRSYFNNTAVNLGNTTTPGYINSSLTFYYNTSASVTWNAIASPQNWNIASLPAAVYWASMNFTGDQNYTSAVSIRTVTLNDSRIIFGNFSSNVSSLLNYSSIQGYQFNATAFNSSQYSAVWVRANFTGAFANYTATNYGVAQFYYNAGKLAAGNYTYTWCANNTLLAYFNSSNQTFQVNQSYLPITLYINGTDGDKTLYNNSVANFTANFSAGNSLNITLYTNLTGAWTLWDNKVSPLTNYTALGPYQARTYMVKANFSNQNYTVGQANHTLTLQYLDDVIPNIASFKYNVTNMTNYSATQGYQFNATVTDGTAVDDVWIEHNFTGTMANYTVTTAQSSEYYYNYGKLAAGFYYVKWWANDTLNNRNTSAIVNYYQVNRSWIPITLYINGTDGDRTLYNNSVANFTANFSSGYSFNITLYTNLTGTWALWDNKVSPLMNYTALSPYQTRAYMIKANFSNQNYSMSQANHTLTLEILYGWLNVSYQSPAAGSSQRANRYSNFNVTANVTCIGGDCGIVTVGLYYNTTGISPDILVDTTVGATPFYIINGSWINDATIVSGLIDIGVSSNPSMAEINGKLALISGEWDGKIEDGWTWTGSAWVDNDTIVTGLGDVGFWSAPSMAEINGVLALICGEGDGSFVGWTWTGSVWVDNSTVVTGLTSGVGRSAPSMAEINGVLSLISGDIIGGFTGWNWDGDSWVANSTIVTGLTDVGDYSRPSITEINGKLALISGNDSSIFAGWTWTGSAWVDNDTIVTGLMGGITYNAPSMYEINEVLSLINGDSVGGFTGWIWMPGNEQSAALNNLESASFSWLVNATGTVGSQYWLDVNFTSSLTQVPSNDSGDFQINITDGTAPNIASFKYNVTNMTNYSSTQGYQFNATVTDGTTVDDVWIEHNFTGTMQNITVTTAQSSEYYYNYGKLAAGYYYVKWWANDTLNNRNTSATVNYYKVNQSYLPITLYINGTNGDRTLYNDSAANFTANFSAGNTFTVQIWSNLTGTWAQEGSGASPFTNIETLNPYQARNYSIVANWTGNQNYTISNASHYLTLQISIGVGSVGMGNASDIYRGEIDNDIYCNTSSFGGNIVADMALQYNNGTVGGWINLNQSFFAKNVSYNATYGTNPRWTQTVTTSGTIARFAVFGNWTSTAQFRCNSTYGVTSNSSSINSIIIMAPPLNTSAEFLPFEPIVVLNDSDSFRVVCNVSALAGNASSVAIYVQYNTTAAQGTWTNITTSTTLKSNESSPAVVSNVASTPISRVFRINSTTVGNYSVRCFANSSSQDGSSQNITRIANISVEKMNQTHVFIEMLDSYADVGRGVAVYMVVNPTDSNLQIDQSNFNFYTRWNNTPELSRTIYLMNTSNYSFVDTDSSTTYNVTARDQLPFTSYTVAPDENATFMIVSTWVFNASVTRDWVAVLNFSSVTYDNVQWEFWNSSELFYDEFATLDEWAGDKGVKGTYWNISTSTYYNGSSSAEATDTDGVRTINHSESTSGYSNINVSFRYNAIGLDGGEYLNADWFDGTSWTSMLSATGDTGGWAYASYILPSTANNNANFAVRLVCNNNLGTEYCYIDTFRIVGSYQSAIVLTPNNPANGTIVDRDSVSPGVADYIMFNVTTDAASTANITFKANLTSPALGQVNLTLGYNTTNANGHAVLYWNPNGSYYAGNYTWWAEANTSYVSNGTRTLLAYGGFNLSFQSATTYPSSSYVLGDNVTINATLRSLGPESPLQLNTSYSANVNATLITADSSTRLAYLNYSAAMAGNWTGNYTLASGDPLSGNPYNVSLNASANYFFTNTTNFTRSFDVLTNITVSITLINAPIQYGALNPQQTSNASTVGGFPMVIRVDNITNVAVDVHVASNSSVMAGSSGQFNIGNMSFANNSAGDDSFALSTSYQLFKESVTVNQNSPGENVSCYWWLAVPNVAPGLYANTVYVYVNQSG